MSSQKPHSSERVPKMLTDGRLAEWDQNRTERIENGYGTDTERVGKGYRTGMGMRVERQQNAFCQAFPVRFLLIGTVNCSIHVATCTQKTLRDCTLFSSRLSGNRRSYSQSFRRLFVLPVFRVQTSGWLNSETSGYPDNSPLDNSPQTTCPWSSNN